MADNNMDEDVPFNEDDLSDLNMLPNLSGLSRLQTDPILQQETGQPTQEEENQEEDTLGDLNMIPNIKGLSRLQTDPAAAQSPNIQQEEINNDTISDLNAYSLPNLSGLSRLQTDPAQHQINTESKTNDSEFENLELIPVFKFCKTAKIIELLENGIDTNFMDWNIFNLYNISSNYTLCICVNYLFSKLGLFTISCINKNKLLSFVCFIEKGYLNIPYHSSLHATDVMINIFHCLIKTELITDPFDKLIILISAMCHDYKHPGFQSSFLIKSKHEISIKYTDKSILEQMHIAETIKVLQNDKYNFLSNIDTNKVKYFKKCLNDMILGTDLTFHKNHMKKLNEIGNGCNDDQKKEDNKLDIMVIGLHVADVVSICKSWNIFEEWGRRIFNEWFIQGDKEKELGLEISKNCDRDKDKDKINDIHSNFIMNFMLPFYEKWSSVFKEKQEFSVWCKQLIDNNHKLKTEGIKL